jgi:hypothetical protein
MRRFAHTSMNGVYDLGGMDGFGAVAVERDEPVFHEPWEMLGYALGSLGPFTMDEARHAIERIEPRLYLSASYYDRIVIGIASLFVEKGILTREELEARAGGSVSAVPAGARRRRPGSREHGARLCRRRPRRGEGRASRPATFAPHATCAGGAASWCM